MNWSDEKYVKLYVRDTLTWLSLSWEARAVLALLLRKVDGAGLLEAGTLELGQAVALQLLVPVDVARRALSELIAIGTVTEVRGGLLLPNFVEAQEATKTESRKKKDQRQRTADKRRLSQLLESPQSLVPDCPVPSPLVPACPPPAQPTTSPPPAQPSPPPAHHQPSGDRPARNRTKPKQAELPDVVPPPPPREPSRAEVLHRRFLEMRQEHLEALGVEVTPDEAISPAYLNSVFKRWCDLWPDAYLPKGAEELDYRTGAEYRCSRLFELFFELQWPARCTTGRDGAGDPQPWPFRVLASEKVWRELVAHEWPEEHASQGAA